MTDKEILDSTASFLQEYFNLEGWSVEETPPSFTLFNIYTKEGEEWAYHVLPINDLGDIEPDFWFPTMKSALSRSITEKNLAFFGVCEAPMGDDHGLVDPEREYFFLVIYLGDRDEFIGRLYDFDMDVIGDFNVFQAFPSLEHADFGIEEIVH